MARRGSASCSGLQSVVISVGRRIPRTSSNILRQTPRSVFYGPVRSKARSATEVGVCPPKRGIDQVWTYRYFVYRVSSVCWRGCNFLPLYASSCSHYEE